MKELDELRAMLTDIAFRLDALERQYKSSTKQPKKSDTQDQLPPRQQVSSQQSPLKPILHAQPTDDKPEAPGNIDYISTDWKTIEESLGKYWTHIVGIGIIVLGIGFLFSYLRQYLNTEVYLVIGAIIGTVLLYLGNRATVKPSEVWRTPYTIGGILAYYCTVFAAHDIFCVIDYRYAFVGYVLIVWLAYGLSCWHHTKALAICSALCATGAIFLVDYCYLTSPYFWLIYAVITGIIFIGTGISRNWPLVSFVEFFCFTALAVRGMIIANHIFYDTNRISHDTYSTLYKLNYACIAMAATILLCMLAPYLYIYVSRKKSLLHYALVLLGTISSAFWLNGLIGVGKKSIESGAQLPWPTACLLRAWCSIELPDEIKIVLVFIVLYAIMIFFLLRSSRKPVAEGFLPFLGTIAYAAVLGIIAFICIQATYILTNCNNYCCQYSLELCALAILFFALSYWAMQRWSLLGAEYPMIKKMPIGLTVAAGLALGHTLITVTGIGRIADVYPIMAVYYGLYGCILVFAGLHKKIGQLRAFGFIALAISLFCTAIMIMNLPNNLERVIACFIVGGLFVGLSYVYQSLAKKFLVE